MRSNLNLSHILFTVLIFLLVYCSISYSRVCAETEYPRVNTDYDTDGDSDGLDFYNFVEEYKVGFCDGSLPCWFDFNFDAHVDDNDLSDFANDFGRSGFVIDMYEPDNAYDEAGVVVVYDQKYQLHNFHQEEDEDWIKFFAIENEKYNIEVSENDCNLVFELYDTTPTGSNWLIQLNTINFNIDEDWTCPQDEDDEDDGGDVYFARVYPVNPSACIATATYSLRINPTTAPFPGTIYGIVKNAANAAVPYASIRTNAGGSAMSFPNGVYVIAQHPASNPPSKEYNITATKAGYSYYVGWTTVPEGGITRKDILMTP